MTTLDTLFLDAGGVLVNPNWERVAAVLGRHGLTVAATALAAAEPGAKHALDVPRHVAGSSDQTRVGAYWELVLARAGVRADRVRLAAPWAELEQYHRTANLWETVPAEVPAALARLRGLGLRLVVVSNANGTLAAKLDRLDLARHFDAILDSHVVGFEKPDPRIFAAALARAGTTAARALHVGDLYEVDVVGARAAGIRGVLLDAADLYAGRDCPRVASLTALAATLAAGTL